MDAISTEQLVAHLQRSGLKTSSESLRLDVHRGLISPLMPSTETPGRSVAARWSPTSVRRSRRMTRLRKRGVNGHVLPLLLFLEDGWGWEKILSDLQAAVARSWALDRAYLNKPTRVRTPADLLENAHEAEAWAGHPDHGAIKDLRAWLFGQEWYGESLGNASPLAFMTSTLPSLLGIDSSSALDVMAIAQAEEHVQQREALQLPASNVGAWLTTLDAESVERGREMFWEVVRQMRKQRRRAGLPGSNPLTLDGLAPTELGTYLRGSTGRPTPAQVLGTMISQAMLMGVIAAGAQSRTSE